MRKKFKHNKALTKRTLGKRATHNVTSNLPHFKSVLREDIGDTNYSLEIDESTNISVQKYLGLVIRYYSRSMEKINTTFLSITELENADANYLDPMPYLGYNFDDKQMIRKRCINFTVELTKELQQQLPDNIQILQNMNIMSVDHVLKPDKGMEIIKLAEHFGLNGDTNDKILSQWKNIQTNKWQNTNDTIKFWHEVSQCKDAGNDNPYQELCSLTLIMLILPHSNADVVE